MERQINSPTMADIEPKEEAGRASWHLEDKTESAEQESVEFNEKFPMKNSEPHIDLSEVIVKKSQNRSYFKTHAISLTTGRKILSAMKKRDTQTLSKLFNTDYPDVKGNTVLHYAVLSACQFRETVDDIYNCLDELMNKEVKLNKPNTKGYTAIALAVCHQQKGCIEHMLKHSSAHGLYLDYYPGDRESTVREIIMQTYPDLKPLLPAPLMESLDSSDSNKKLLAALQHDKYSTFRENLNSTNPNPWYDEPYHSTLLEIACQMEKGKEFVELLLEKGANPNIRNPYTGTPLLHATARSGNFDILEILLKKEEIDVSVRDKEERTILHWWAGVRERKSDDKKSLENCFQLLMNREFYLKAAINFRDSSGKSSLYTAVECGFQDRATLLLTWGADVMDFEHGSKLLLSDNLSMLESILDDCLESNDEPVTSEDYKLTFRYRLLMNIYPRMAESLHLRELLRHSVMSTFLNFKWQQLRLIFFVDLAFYFIFLLSLSAYILYSESYTKNDSGVANKSTATLIFDNRYIRCGIDDANFIYQTRLRREGTRTTDDNSLQFLWSFLMITLGLLAARELFQLLVDRWKYVHSVQNWLKVILIIVTFISCSGVADNVEVEIHFSAVAVLLGWLELLLISGRLPLLSEQLEMLKTVSLTFLRFMVGYAFLLIAFALSFYILFKGSFELDGTEMFANPFLSVLKTIVMFTGEFDASSLSFDILPYTSHVIFLLFVFLVTIILLNLLNGLAVNDTDAIRKKAKTLSLVARVKLIYNIEAVLTQLPRFMTPSLDPTEDTFVLYPNRANSIGFATSRSIFRIITKKKQLPKKKKPNVKQDKWSFFTEKFSELQLRQKELEKKLDSKFDETNHILLLQKEREKKFDLKFEEMTDLLFRHKEFEKIFDLIFEEMKHNLLQHKELEKKFDLKFEETKHFFLQIMARLDIRESEGNLAVS